MRLSLEESEKYIRARRSVYPKQFEQGELSKEEILQLLNVAKYAPTHKKTEPWRFVVFQGAKMEALVELQIEIMIEQKGDADEYLQKAGKMRDKCKQTGAIIAVVMSRDENERIPQFEEEWAVATAVQNIQLHASSLNLGAYWSTGGGMDHEKVRSLLQIDNKDRHMGWLFVGRFSGEIERPNNRKPVEEFVRWV